MDEHESYFVVVSCSSKSGIIEIEASEDGDPLLLTATDVARQRIPVPIKPGKPGGEAILSHLSRKDGAKVAASKDVVNDLFGWDL